MIKAFILILLLVTIIFFGAWASISPLINSRNYLQIFLTIAYNFAAVLSIVAASYLWLRSHNLKFYLWIQRQRHKYLPSKSSTWDIQARWQSTLSYNILDEFENWISKHYSGRFSVWKKHDNLRTYQLDGRFNLEVSFELSSLSNNHFTSIYVLRIYALTVNFSESQDILLNDVMPQIDFMSSHTYPIPEGQDYNLTMTFSDNINPFLGLYVQGLHPKEIQQFQITLSPKSYSMATSSYIRVSSQYLSITTHSPREFHIMAQDFLSFAPRLAKTAT